MKNSKYESFGAGRAGQGQIDLRNGEIVFVHDDTSSDSNILPISVSHVYGTSSALNHDESSVCGKGFRLNLHQKLRKTNDDPNDTSYILTDAAGKEYDFKKLYYYLNSEGKRVYHKTINGKEVKLVPEDISIDFDRRLTYHDGTEKHEIFTELKTDSGLVLITELKGFINAEKIETRHEELLQIEEEVKSLERSIEDLEFSMEEYGRIHCADYLNLKKLQTDLQDLSIRMESKNQDAFEELVDCQDELLRLNSSYNDLIKKGFHNIGGLKIKDGTDEISEEDVVNNNKNEVRVNYDFNFDPVKSRFTYADSVGREMEKLSLLASYGEGYADDHYGSAAASDNSKRIKRVIQFLQERFNEKLETESQNIREKSFELDEKRWEDQKALMELKEEMLELQTEFGEAKDKYDDVEEQRTEERYNILTERAEIDIFVAKNMLEYRRFILRQYEERTSVNFISDNNGLTYGFNRAGDLVVIWDRYENYASLIYENGKLIGITDAEEKETVFEYIDEKLSAIIDTLDRRTEFVYAEEYLEKIIYPNGDESSFAYHNGLLCDMMPPIGIGTRLKYDLRNRPVKIVSVTTVGSITSDGITKSDETEIEDVVEIEYKANEASTDVTDPKTNYRTTYLFNSEGDCVTEYAKLDDVMKIIRTHDVGRRRCYFSMQQTDFDNNLFDRATASEQNNPNVIRLPDGDVIIRGNVHSFDLPAHVMSNRFTEWYIDPDHLPEHATDLILSGFATADSDETTDRRKTEYCDHSEPDDPHTPSVTDPAVKNRRFELRAEITYHDESTNESEVKTFIASYDWRTGTKQFAAVPITLNENEKGEPIKPLSIKITADYSHNRNVCRFSELSLADGDWAYTETDDEHRKIFECGSRNITDRTVDGVKVGKFISRGESFFEYDGKGNLVRERTVLTKDGISKAYVTKHEYNKRSKLIRTTSPNGIVSETVYDKRGIAVRSFAYHKSNPANRFVQENEHDENGRVTAEIDARGENKTIFEYLNGTNIIKGSVAPDGQKFSIGTDPHTDELLAISASVHGEPNGTEFGYTKGFLTHLVSGGTRYDYGYDNRGRKTAISIDGTPHVQFAFETDGNSGSDGSDNNSGNNNGGGNDDGNSDRNAGNEIAVTAYANGERYQTVTDKFGKLLTVHRIIDGIKTILITNHYDKDGILTGTTDHLAAKAARFVYNDDGSLNTEANGNVRTVRDYNIEGSVRKVRYVFNEGIDDQVYENIYDNEGRVTQITLPGDRSEIIEYDGLGRISTINHPVHRERINYYQNGDNATSLITSIEHDNGRTKYAYDKNGNISEIRENGRLSVRYDYDGLNRIVREDNVRLNRSVTFDYDTNGNILSKNTYPLSNSIDLISGEEIRYGYAGTGNRDRLTSFNGETFEYDVLGNPTVYRNNDLKWDNLKDLVQYNDVKFEYDAFGLRQRKIHNGTETEFCWSGSKLIAEKRISAKNEDLELNDHLTDGNLTDGHLADDHLTDDPSYSNATIVNISYLQGTGGLAGFTISKNGGTCERTYYYRKNIRGDITHIFDNDGNIKAEYIYDAWGNHKVLDADGNENTDTDFIGNLNPYRYRGYYHDIETGLYYLRTRYYDPLTGRFVNADSVAVFDETKTDINGLNLYAYCANNPIMFVDPTGQLFDLFNNTFIRPVGDALGAAADWAKDNWGLIVTAVIIVASVALIATGIGAPLGALALIKVGMGVGGLLGIGVSAASQWLTTGSINFEVVAIDGLVGMVTGAIGASGANLLLMAGIGFSLSAFGSILGDLVENNWDLNQVNLGKALVAGGLGATPFLRKKWLTSTNQTSKKQHKIIIKIREMSEMRSGTLESGVMAGVSLIPGMWFGMK